MITSTDYKTALIIVNEYEKQLPEATMIPCYILSTQNMGDRLITFVTTDKGYADRMYATGDYIMHTSQLIDPNRT